MYNIEMDISSIISDIDKQIAQLEAARAAIASINESSSATSTPVAKKRGRPAGSTNAVKTVKKSTKRVMSPEGRAAIAAAQAKRWAAKHKADKKAAKTVTAKKAVPATD
jgi:hypothetical protein